MVEESIPKKIRVSLGSAILLGLTKGIMDVELTALYLLTYRSGKCIANCSFCSQARSSTSNASMLSRITWPVFSSEKVVTHMKGMKRDLVRRVCIQVMNYPNMFEEVLRLVCRSYHEVQIPISVSCHPLIFEQIKQLGS